MSRALSPYLYEDETARVDALARALPWSPAQSEKTGQRAADLIRRIRRNYRPLGQLESFMQHYALNTAEGLALMCLAEALLRIPDKATAGDLIRDKMRAADWLADMGGPRDWVVKAAGVGLMMSSKTLESALAKIGEPFIREAMVGAIRIMGRQFVLGRDIAEAVKHARSYERRGYRMSYDILGEGARTSADAAKYFEAYIQAIGYIGQNVDANNKDHTGISVKLSALYPRYSYAQKERCVPVLTEKLLALSKAAASRGLRVTVDAEEVSRLELSLDIIGGVLKDKGLSGWEGFGLAVQAYQKRSFALLDTLAGMARAEARRLQVRLVKGAYWDSEVKNAQVLGLPDYPVFTRKVNTDLSYMACAHKMLTNPAAFYPMFGTHNAYTACYIMEKAAETGADFEFQRLHGMGETLADILLEDGAKAGIYAPVGPHEDLLAYLVRRLLENGANSSFVNKVLDPETPVEELSVDPARKAEEKMQKRHTKIPLPEEVYQSEFPQGRRNSQGIDLTDPDTVEKLLSDLASFTGLYEARPLVGGHTYGAAPEEVVNPGDSSDIVGKVFSATEKDVETAFQIINDKAFRNWSGTPVEQRGQALERFADLMEENCAELMAICIREAGKTIPDALAEVREAVDFCRYYANRGQEDFREDGHPLPGPTGESNVLTLVGRGAFVCISPWNFPLAIFTGQVTAALMAGNCVIAKPARQTSLIAMKAVQLMHEAGVPKDVLHFMPGDGRKIGMALVAHKDTAGVVFTGSTEVAWEINKTLANKKAPIVPLIAETGGQNAMIVDSSALPEQVVDDVLLSAFGSAGQRCSALRILCLQDDIADKIITMLKGAMQELRIGSPAFLSSDIGPVIDGRAKEGLMEHRDFLRSFGKLIAEVPVDEAVKASGHYFAPCAFELPDLKRIEREVFGPVLHVVRFRKNELGQLIEEINSKGYGLTMGVHSRIDAFQEEVVRNLRAGNAYVNRSMIGAVVGSQPFGGQGLSGTGPKAGGPHYLPRFANEKVVCVNTTASGGNTTLVSLEE